MFTFHRIKRYFCIQGPTNYIVTCSVFAVRAVSQPPNTPPARMPIIRNSLFNVLSAQLQIRTQLLFQTHTQTLHELNLSSNLKI